MNATPVAFILWLFKCLATAFSLLTRYIFAAMRVDARHLAWNGRLAVDAGHVRLYVCAGLCGEPADNAAHAFSRGTDSGWFANLSCLAHSSLIALFANLTGNDPIVTARIAPF